MIIVNEKKIINDKFFSNEKEYYNYLMKRSNNNYTIYRISISEINSKLFIEIMYRFHFENFNYFECICSNSNHNVYNAYFDFDKKIYLIECSIKLGRKIYIWPFDGHHKNTKLLIHRNLINSRYLGNETHFITKIFNFS